jgi:hypothetical protein
MQLAETAIYHINLIVEINYYLMLRSGASYPVCRAEHRYLN